MADDVAITAGTGTNIATDQIGAGHHYQRVKVSDGTADSENHWVIDSSGAAYFVGNVASGAADSGNPVKVGGKYNATPPTLTDGNRGDMQVDSRGNLRISIVNANSTTPAIVGNPSADGYAALDGPWVNGQLQMFNGSTWDRVRGDVTNGLDVDVTRTGGGVDAHDAASTQNPLQMGGIASAAAPTNVSADGDAVRTWHKRNGALCVDLMLGGTQIEANVISIDAHSAGGNGIKNIAYLYGYNGSTFDRLRTENTGTLLTAPKPSTTGGLSSATGSIAATKTDIKTSAGQVYGWFFYNPNTTVAYVQFFNLTAANVTLGTSVAVYSLPIPPTSGANVMHDLGIAHSTAISIAVTTTRTGLTGPGSTVDFNIFYA